MRWTIRLGTLFGIRIQMHVTFLVLLAGVAVYAQLSAGDPLRTTLDLLLIFACVVLHELGHALMARRFGIATREILLLPIGGVAMLDRMPENPAQEIQVALAGPAVNVVIATILGAWLFAHGAGAGAIFELAQGKGTIEFLLFANLVMLTFNLIPAFPMDGGRVLRGTLALFVPYTRATRIASLVGQGFAIVFALVAVFSTHYILLLIATFVFVTAGKERAIVQTRSALVGIPVSAAMVTAFVSLETRHEIAYAVDLLLAGEQQDFPVLEDGQLIGMLNRSELLAGLRKEGAEAPIGRLARFDVEPIESTMPLDAAWQRMRAGRVSALPVVSRGRLVGLLTLGNISELMLVQEARQRHAGIA